MSYLEIRQLQRLFGGMAGVRGFDFAAERGEFISLLGPSGCGKTTVLRSVAGFERPDRGEIRLDTRDLVPLPPSRREIGMVFQNYALFPNMSVADNIGFGLRIAKRPAAEIRARTAEMLDLIRLADLAPRYPYQLSGGQQQRVALARALAVQPKLLLLDEPLSALDAKIRVALRDEIRAVQQRLGITTLFVTHDQQEALAVSDRIVVMNEGRIEQVGTPAEVYNFPRSRFVASFVGTLNLLEAELVAGRPGEALVEGQPVRVTSPSPKLDTGGRPCTLAIRPEAITIGEATPDRNTLRATVDSTEFLGAVVRIRCLIGRQRLTLDTFNNPGRPPPAGGTIVHLIVAPADTQVLAE